MPNAIPANLSDLTFDAVDLQRADLSLHLDVVMGLNDGLEVRGEDTIIPGAAGRTARSRKRDVRHIQLAGWLQGTGATEVLRLEDYQDLRDEIEALFDPSAAPAALAGTALDGTTRTIDARTISIAWNESPAMGAGQLSIALDSVDPDWVVT